jgi:hypothetical protein
MKIHPPVDQKDPCLPIQVDLSAMLDGELDAASIRRVMVHSDVCPSCKCFLDGIRRQAHAHRELNEAQMMSEFDGASRPAAAQSGQPGPTSRRAQALRKQLIKNREQLARIFYELGRGFVLMGTSPKFSRTVAREPVPIPDMFMRGRNLLDEVERAAGAFAAPATDGALGGEWVRAKSLFACGKLESPDENMRKGRQLLRDALALQPDYHQARIYLGHAHHVVQEMAEARREFGIVLERSEDPVMRAFALENLGSVHLDEGHPEMGFPLFVELVDSGVIEREPRFYTTFFNLAVCQGLLGEWAECRRWLTRLYAEFPHKRRAIARELRTREQFASLLGRDANMRQSFESEFPEWFTTAGAPRQEVPR